MPEISELELLVKAKGIQAVRRDFRRLEKDSVSGFNRMKKAVFSIKGALTGLAGAFVLRQGLRFIDQTISQIDQLDKLSGRLGVSIEALSEYELVTEKAGVSQQAFTVGLQRMVRRISEAAQGTGTAKDALKELGLEADQLNAMAPEEQFERIADAMAGVETQADRVRLAMRLFDTEGVALIQTMDRGAEGIRELREQARRLGLTLTEEDARAAREAKDAMADFNALLTGLSRRTIIPLIQNLNDFAGALGLIPITPAAKIRAIRSELDSMNDTLEDLLKKQQSPTRSFVDNLFGASVKEKIEKVTDDIRLAEQSLARLEKQSEKRTTVVTPAKIGGKDEKSQRAALERELTLELKTEIDRRIFLVNEEKQKRFEIINKEVSDVKERSGLRVKIEESAQKQITEIQENEVKKRIANAQREAEKEKAEQKKVADEKARIGRQISDLDRELNLAALSESERRIELVKEEQQERLELVEKGVQDEAKAADLRVRINESASEKIKDIVEEDAQKTQKLLADLSGELRDQMSGALFDILQGSEVSFEGIADNFKRMIDRMVADWLAAQFQQKIFGKIGQSGGGLLQSLFGGVASFFGGGGGGLSAASAGLTAGGPGNFAGGGAALTLSAHRGGRIGEDSFSKRLVDPRIFRLAERFHEGRIAGLKANEVPAILEKGEQVLSKEQVASGQGSRAVNVTVNITTPDADSFRRSEGQITAQMARAISSARRHM